MIHLSCAVLYLQDSYYVHEIRSMSTVAGIYYSITIDFATMNISATLVSRLMAALSCASYICMAQTECFLTRFSSYLTAKRI